MKLFDTKLICFISSFPSYGKKLTELNIFLAAHYTALGLNSSVLESSFLLDGKIINQIINQQFFG